MTSPSILKPIVALAAISNQAEKQKASSLLIYITSIKAESDPPIAKDHRIKKGSLPL